MLFRSEVSDDYSFVTWVAQQVAAVLTPSLVALLTGGSVADYIEKGPGYPLGTIGKVAWYALFVWGIGFYLAMLVHRLFRRAAAVGRWVWILPTFFFLLMFFNDVFKHSLSSAFSEFFNPGPNGEAWWALMIFTYPTCSAVLYSLGMFLALRQDRRRNAAPSFPT
jgi:hypothetical protein